ncbi:ComEC family competence protein [Flavobacterium amnicola]|uniref:ComEC family competence protein n=1 Tax=Flavobacterium amnicola TaxID=2506422 RepID=A0A4Q1K7Q5_9FLAO|nr:ComEC/Rec2 family competence protein [Flavobacterium amnicola]RXR21304.1 ComEC family competence protein [Flavobacterium amnicola]
MMITRFPIARITFWFIGGILLAFYAKPNLTTALFFLGITLLFCVYSFYKSNKTFTPNSTFGISLYLVFFSIGITTTLFHNETLFKNHYTQNESNFEDSKNFHLVLLEKLKNSAKYNRYFAKVISIENKSSCGKILLNIKKDSVEKTIKIGNQLLVHDQLLHHFKPNNPNQFDYGQYLETKGIYAQIYTDPTAVKISTKIEKGIFYYTSNFRTTIVENLAKSGFKKEELAVITALILGQQQDISPEVLRDYQYAGAVHILSVSGLHVGFILFFITFLLQPIPNTKLGNTSKLVIVILSLWLFAFVAGLAPSVVRSTVMFSFIAVGMHLKRETNTFHTAIVSLFLILLFEPLFLFDIGFQLSYLAVFSILWLQPLLDKIWQPKNKIITYFWNILTVSFAAQIGTLPLSIYYFHQFPGLFFITNLILIPFLSVIMALGTLLMILAYLDWIPMLLSKTVEVCITITNTIINKIASVESFVLTAIPLSFSLMLLAYLILISWTIWIQKPKFSKLLAALASLFLFQIILFSTKWNSEKNGELIVFNVMKKSIIAMKNDSSINLFASEAITKNSFEERMLQTYATANYSKISKTEPLSNTLYFNHKKILVIDSSAVYNTSISPDIVLLTHSPKINLERLLATQHPEIVIADASNFKNYTTAWKQTCLKRKIPFHSTYEKGFYSLKK